MSTKDTHLYITQNAPFVYDISVKNDDLTPKNLTGYTASMYIAKYFESTTNYQVTAVVVDPTGGVIRVSLSSESTGILPSGAMNYTIFAREAATDQTIVIKGPVTVIPTVFP